MPGTLPRLIPSANPNDTVEVQDTTLGMDIVSRYHCNTWEEVASNGGAPFDVIVIGAGMFGRIARKRFIVTARKVCCAFSCWTAAAFWFLNTHKISARWTSSRRALRWCATMPKIPARGIGFGVLRGIAVRLSPAWRIALADVPSIGVDGRRNDPQKTLPIGWRTSAII